MIRRRGLLGVVLALAAASAGTAARASDFYAGRTINVYIGFNVGGGYDFYARLLARHLGRHIPGNPSLIPQNMPGAAGLKVASYMHQAAPKDGTAIATSAESVALEQALGGAGGSTGIDYDATRFGWIGRLTPIASAFFTWHTSKVRSIEDARRHESVFGSSGLGGITGYTPKALNSLAGTRFKVVTGYTGSASVVLAMERGEVEGGFWPWPELGQQKPEWLSERRINILYLVAGRRAPDLPDVPTSEELGTTPEAREILRFLGSTTEIGRAYFTTPDVPPERLAILRRGFEAMVRDPAFLQDAQRSSWRIDAMSGEDLQRLVAGVVGFPRPLIEKARAARQ